MKRQRAKPTQRAIAGYYALVRSAADEGDDAKPVKPQQRQLSDEVQPPLKV
ncbi:hypothetical protein [Vreelandella rituensis]|uniref:hypothetical protein n=1 Tax=Vreelandella rituensis TaxID=2282306 RepID=UPI0015F07CC5|nr:hypothetical protein [Halomonas rituensis]